MSLLGIISDGSRGSCCCSGDVGGWLPMLRGVQRPGKLAAFLSERWHFGLPQTDGENGSIVAELGAGKEGEISSDDYRPRTIQWRNEIRLHSPKSHSYFDHIL